MSTSVPERVVLGASALARDWYLDVNTGTAAVPVWTPVNGLTAFQPALEQTLQDDSDYDSGGYRSQTSTALAWSLQTTVARKVYPGDEATFDPGQEFLRLKAEEHGGDNSVDVRWYRMGAVRTEAYRGRAATSYAPQGGAMDALDTAQINLTGQGKRQSITHPDPTEG